MKKNSLTLAVLVLTMVISAFSLQPPSYKFAVYCCNFFSTEKDLSNFTITVNQPSHLYIETITPTLNWFRVEDIDANATISVTEFNSSFELCDAIATTSNLLKDETADILGQLDLYNKE